MQDFFSLLRSAYDEAYDEFHVDSDELGVARFPRIGVCKHNLHFENDSPSPFYQTMLHISKVGKFADLLTSSDEGGGKVDDDLPQHRYSLRECGISVTAPCSSVKGDDDDRGGVGAMEYHSDGSKGEFTILMTVEDIASGVGGLTYVPSSHMDYVEGIGHGQLDLNYQVSRSLEYLYASFAPIIIDARTLHAVKGNVTDQWRFVLWYIYD